MRNEVRDWMIDAATDKICKLEHLRNRLHPSNPVLETLQRSIDTAYAMAEEFEKEFGGGDK